MTVYSSELTLREARAIYFELNDFGDGGYQDSWVKSRVGSLPVYFPNTRARREVVPYHDLHHILTEYTTDWTGEAEISAWDVATGSTRNHAAWLLNLLGYAVGLLLNPRRVYRAFLRGRQSKNLYSLPFDDELLGQTVGRMREVSHLDVETKPASVEDQLAFIFWSAVAALTYLAVVAFTVAPFFVAGLMIYRRLGA
jgi:hypothetical protein